VLSAEELRARADSLGWFHPIDLGQGVVTRGLSKGPFLGAEELPDLTGKSVLDIGAWDGYYSFLAERLGAARVVALDHYVWGVDMVAREKYWAACAQRGELPDHERDTTEFWRPELPGRRAFDFAREVLNSKVEPMVADFATVDLDTVGRFDVVLYLGVLYHMKEPLRALERLRKVTKEVAVIETQAIAVSGVEELGLLQFFAGDEFMHDFGNWYIPSLEAIRQLVRAAGFSGMTTVVGPESAQWSGSKRHPRLAALRRALQRSGTPSPVDHQRCAYYRAVVHAHV